MRNLKILIIIVLIFTSINIFSIGIIYAYDIGLQVSPNRIFNNIEPGKSYTFKLLLFQNLYPSEKISILLKSFTLTNDGANFSPDLNEELKNWIQPLPDNILLPLNQSLEVDLTLKIPKEANHFGGYSFALIFQPNNITNNSKEQSTVIKQDIAIPIILNLVSNSQTIDEAEISSLKISNFEILNNTDYSISVENIGKTHIIPQGVLQLDKEQGIGIESYKIDFNNKKEIILSGSSKNFDGSIKFDGLTLGIYKAKLDLVYGVMNKVITDEVTVVIIPWWVLVILGLLIILSMVYIFLKKIKNKKNYEKK